jgi:DnaJ-class molecular chaperone
MTDASLIPTAATEECDVCCGSGVYPIINRYGQQLYEIECPECSGDGLKCGPAI